VISSNGAPKRAAARDECREVVPHVPREAVAAERGVENVVDDERLRTASGSVKNHPIEWFPARRLRAGAGHFSPIVREGLGIHDGSAGSRDAYWTGNDRRSSAAIHRGRGSGRRLVVPLSRKLN
jgi:hypothetical protein